MFVGSAGTGKSVIITNRLEKFPSQNFMISTIPLNCIILIEKFFIKFYSFEFIDYTTSEMLQNSLEKPLEKKAGRTYGAPGNRQLIYFIGNLGHRIFANWRTSWGYTSESQMAIRQY
jgi:dynein heavy chain